MDTIILELAEELKKAGNPNPKLLADIIYKHNRNITDNAQHYSKKRVVSFYLKTKTNNPERFSSWNLEPEIVHMLDELLKMKPRRTASGVATITVITKPYRCSNNCLYCPNDIRMPKSYLYDEPACQRAERNYFDPYLQVVSRLRALTQMGHITDKIELIVLGGTWNDYPREYQIWFIRELFCALNDGDKAEENAQKRRDFYKQCGLTHNSEELTVFTQDMQARVTNRELTYNQAVQDLYSNSCAWQKASAIQHATLQEVSDCHRINEKASHRVVGLVVETRPDMITSNTLTLMRQLGCTKVQMGIQSLNPEILAANNRSVTTPRIERAFALLRSYGFKIHAHFMVNLLEATPQTDKLDYERFVTEAPFQPDEVKLYPCSLVAGTDLCAHYNDGTWAPYSEEDLLDVLIHDVVCTPPFIRISRMIRDICAQDILVGNKKTNLRQLVENRIHDQTLPVQEIRYREINDASAENMSLTLTDYIYQTTMSEEHFLSWITENNSIAGFLRLSLPNQSWVQDNQQDLAIGLQEAMIREVHVYGKVAQIHKAGQGVQHLGLGKKLIAQATSIAQTHGYTKLNVISSVGTRDYYRRIGFSDNGLYQQMDIRP